jgi:hypothetical protein
MSRSEDAYQTYLYMCRKLGCPILTQEAYEKAISTIHSTENKIDAILRNGKRTKDK